MTSEKGYHEQEKERIQLESLGAKIIICQCDSEGHIDLDDALGVCLEILHSSL